VHSISGNLQQSFDYGEVMRIFNPQNRIIRLSALNGDLVVGLVQAVFPKKRLGFGARLNAGGFMGLVPL